jgi:hypothetical protein
MNTPEIDRIMNTPDAQVDTDRALAHIRERIERERIRPVVTAPRAPRTSGASLWLRGAAVAASVALIAVLLTVTGVAETILTIFEPKQVVAVPITTADLRGAQGFAQYGTLEWSTQPQPYNVPDLATAEQDSGFRILRPTLPTGVTITKTQYGVMPRTTATFTFSAERTRATAARLQRTPPPMPANIDGAKLFITGGPAVVQFFDDGSSAPTGATGASPLSGMPRLIVVQGKGPVVQSDGVTVEQLQQYLLAQPGISPQLAAQIKAIKDPSSTLPIPIPVDMATTKNVTVQGVQGVFVGDSTGLGSAVIWSKDGLVFGVAGTLTEAQIMAVANSLH